MRIPAVVAWIACCVPLLLHARVASAGGMEPFLERLSATARARGGAAIPVASGSPIRAWDAGEAGRGRVRLQITRAPGASWQAIRSRMESAGPMVAWEIESGERAQAVAGVADLPAIAGCDGVRYVERPPRPLPLLDTETVSEVRSEGTDRIGAPALHAAGYLGQDVRIAVVDLGFAGYERLLGTELPPRVTIRSYYHGRNGDGDITGEGEDHGTACAEIVHDIAPEAHLYLVNIETLLDLDRAVGWLIEQDVAVISHSVGWYFGGLDGTGPVNEIADRAAAAGIVWVNASGNEAERHTWAAARDADGDGEFEFEGGDERIDFADVPSGQRLDLVLLWDQWPSAVGTDLALEILDAEDQVVATSDEGGLTSPYAFRQVEWVSPDGMPVSVRVRRIDGDLTGRTLHLFRVGQGVRMQEHMLRDRSLLCPADSRSVLAVGAADWRSESLDSYSSRGALDAPPSEMKPELLAPVGVSTATYGSEGFRGTSAAAPHAAGAAALVCGTGIGGALTRLQWTGEEILLILSRSATADAAVVPLRWGHLRVPGAGALTRSPATPVLELAANPARSAVRWFPASAPVTIHDAGGRVVAGGVLSPWNGRDASGALVPAGRYWISAPGRRPAAVLWLGL